jgi:hypothetical protein
MSNIAQSQFDIENSITVNNTDGAIDFSAPLSLIDWLQSINIQYYSLNTYAAYNQYLNQWFVTKQVSKQEQVSTTTGLYISLFQNISLNYSTPEEQRYITNIDYSNPRQLATVLPFFTKRIKQICNYFITLRENTKGTVARQNIRGSKQGIEKILNYELSNYITNSEFQNYIGLQNIDIDKFKANSSINIVDLYDISTNYFDVSSNVYDEQLFLNFQEAIRNQIRKYPVFITELGTNNFSITLDESGFNLSLLKDKDFINCYNNQDESNLNLNNFIDLIKSNIGTDFYYLSVGSTATNYTSGILFKADNKVESYLNKYFPTTITTPVTSGLLTNRQIGTYFTPDKQNIANFYSFGVSYQLNNLQPNTIYTFPDPSKYGNISGLTQISFDTPFVFHDDVAFLKESKTNTYQRGQAISDPLLKTFCGYSSKSENTISDTLGIERYTDPEDFFKNDLKNIWGNDDIYPTTNILPVNTRFNDLHVSDKTLVECKPDIFGNVFGLFKKIKKITNPFDFLPTYQNTCLQLDGGNYSTSTYQLITDTLDFTNFTPTNYIISYEFTPSNFCTKEINFNIIQYIGNLFTSANYNIWTGNNFTNPSNQYTVYDSGEFQVKSKDMIQSATFVDSYESVDSITGLADTQLETYTDTLTANSSLYDERHNTYGDMYVRLQNSTVEQLSTVFIPIFNSLPSEVVSEVNNKLKSFSIIENTMILSTSAYHVFCPIDFDYTTNTYSTGLANIQYIKCNPGLNLSNIWYSQSNRTILLARQATATIFNTVSAPIIYPEIYIYLNNKLKKIYPQDTHSSTLSVYSTINTEYMLYFDRAEIPSLSYNSYLDKYCLSYIARDPSDMVYIINNFFKYNLNIYDVEATVFKPHCFCHSESYFNNMISSVVNITSYASSTPILSMSGLNIH